MTATVHATVSPSVECTGNGLGVMTRKWGRVRVVRRDKSRTQKPTATHTRKFVRLVVADFHIVMRSWCTVVLESLT